MNNLKYYEDSLAYDFSLFAPAEKVDSRQAKKKGKIIDIPDNQKRRARRRKQAALRVSGKVSAILVTVFVIAMLAGNVYLRSQINETEYRIAKVNEEINVAKSALDSVSFRVEQKISYKNLEDAAIAMGMRKMDKTQIVYLRTNKDDKAVVHNGELSADNNQ